MSDTQKNKNNNSLFIFQIIFGGIGLVLCAIAFLIYRHQAAFVENSLSAEGQVIDFEKRAGSTNSSQSSKRYIWVPVVQFTTEDGKVVTFTESAGGVGNDGLTKGSLVPVLYDPSEPSFASISSFFHLWIGFIIVSFFGVIFSLIGFLLFSIPFVIR